MNKKAEWICTEDCHKKNKIQQRHGDIVYISKRFSSSSPLMHKCRH